MQHLHEEFGRVSTITGTATGTTDPRNHHSAPRSPLIVGIDPGLSGALAVLTATGEFERVCDLPVIRDRSLAWIDGSELQSTLLDALRGRAARAVVERVSAMPKQGVASSFAFGVGFGSILSVLQAMHVSVELITPAVWKRALGLSRDKHASLHKARLLFPTAELHLAKHEGRAEALLLAHYSVRQVAPPTCTRTGIPARFCTCAGPHEVSP
jgi:crossover junction endodeoxyribonuclease RuvC